MAISITNFNPVWEFIQPNFGPMMGTPIPQFYDGTYMFLQCSINSGTSVSVNVSLYDKKPEYTPGESGSVVYNNARVITNLNYGSFNTDVQGNVLLAATDYVVSCSVVANPGVDFTIIDLSGSVI